MVPARGVVSERQGKRIPLCGPGSWASAERYLVRYESRATPRGARERKVRRRFHLVGNREL